MLKKEIKKIVESMNEWNNIVQIGNDSVRLCAAGYIVNNVVRYTNKKELIDSLYED